MLPTEFCDQECAKVTLEDLANLEPIAPFLCFWACTATIRLQASGNKTFFKTNTRQIVGFCMRTRVSPGQVQDLELIVIGEYKLIQSDHRPAEVVVATRWEEDIAYHESFGLGTVAYSDWEKIEWKMILVG